MTMMLRFTWMYIFLLMARARRNKRDVELHQVDLVTRPMGDVTLICKTDHFSLHDVSLIRWYMHDIMAPLYTFSVTPHINTIEDRYRDIVLNASTTSVHGGVSSKLQLHTNLSDRHIYSCGIAIVDGPFIRKKLKIRFHKPMVHITYWIVNSNHSAESSFSVLANITCHAEVTDGKPKYRIWYDHRPFINHNPARMHYEENKTGFYYSSTWSELIELSDDGLVLCEVEDRRGWHTEVQNVILFPALTSNPDEAHNSTSNMESTVTIEPFEWPSMWGVVPVIIILGIFVVMIYLHFKMGKQITYMKDNCAIAHDQTAPQRNLPEQYVKEQQLGGDRPVVPYSRIVMPKNLPEQCVNSGKIGAERSSNVGEFTLNIEYEPDCDDGVEDANAGSNEGSDAGCYSSNPPTNRYGMANDKGNSTKGTLRYRGTAKKLV